VDFISKENPATVAAAKKMMMDLVEKTADGGGSLLLVSMVDIPKGGTDAKYAMVAVKSVETAVGMLAFGAAMLSERSGLCLEDVLKSPGERASLMMRNQKKV